MNAMSDKAREVTLRRRAERRLLRLERCRRKDPAAAGWGTYRLIDSVTGEVFAASDDPRDGGYGLSLDMVAELLTPGSS